MTSGVGGFFSSIFDPRPTATDRRRTGRNAQVGYPAAGVEFHHHLSLCPDISYDEKQSC